MSGGLPVRALEALAGYWCRILGAVCLEGRIPHPLQGLASSPRSCPDIVSDVSGRTSSGTGFAPGGREGCRGGRPRSGSWLLQSSFPGGKGDAGLASRDQPLSPEQVCSPNSVQDGDHSLCASLHPRGGFPSFRRSEGRVFPDTDASVLKEAIAVPVGRGCLPVQSPVLRVVDCPSGIHSGVCSGLCVGALLWDSSSQVPGRLAGPRLFGDRGQKECPGSALALLLPWDSDKRGEVRSRTLTDCRLPRHDINFCRWQRHFVLCPFPELSFGRWCWDTWLRWRSWFLTVAFECALCSGI